MGNDYFYYKSEEMLIAKKLFSIGEERKRAKMKRRGWVCGTYASSKMKGIAHYLHFKYEDNPIVLKLLCHKWELYEQNKSAEEVRKEAEHLGIDLEEEEKIVLGKVPRVIVNPGSLLSFD